MKKTITLPTLEHYLQQSTLTPEQREELRAEFHKTNGDAEVLNKAVRLNGRKGMSKVSEFQTK